MAKRKKVEAKFDTNTLRGIDIANSMANEAMMATARKGKKDGKRK